MSQLERDFLGTIRVLKLPEPVREYRFAPPRRFRFDFAWPDSKLAVECEGGVWTRGRHTRGAGFEKDCEKGNLAILHNWRVLRFTVGMVKSWEAARTVERILKNNR